MCAHVGFIVRLCVYSGFYYLVQGSVRQPKFGAVIMWSICEKIDLSAHILKLLVLLLYFDVIIEVC